MENEQRKNAVKKWLESNMSVVDIRLVEQRHDLSGFRDEIERYLEERLNKLEPYSLISANDLLKKEFPPTKWLVEGYIEDNSIVFFGGAYKSFKTLSALHLAVSIASGKPFLGVFQTNKQKVLYINEENSERLIQKRLKLLKNGMNIDGEMDIDFMNKEGLKIENNHLRNKLEKTIKDSGAKLVIIDSFIRVITSKENESETINKVHTDILSPISKKYGTTWILIHHTRKGQDRKGKQLTGEELRGSGDIPGCADTVLLFIRKDRNSFIIIHDKARDSEELEPRKVQTNWTDDAIKPEIIDSGDEIIAKPPNADEVCADTILQYFQDNSIEKFQTKEIKVAMKKLGHSETIVGKALKLLKKKKKIRLIKRGHYEVLRGEQGSLGLEGFEPFKPSKP